MKIGEFFEKQVQWITLGLAVAWLLWVGWAYWINRPEVEINGTKFSAGSVDEHIRDTDMQALATKIGNPNVPPALLDVPDFTETFAKSMSGSQPVNLPVAVVYSPPPYSAIDTGNGINKKPKILVASFPNVVVPTEVAVISGRSQIVQPAEKPKILMAVNNNGENGNGGARADNEVVQPQSQPQPQLQQGGAAPLPGQPVGLQMDKNWITVFAKLNFNEQDSEFAKVNIPPFLMQKQYIEVQLQRQEVLPQGGFGKIETVPGLPMNEAPVARKNAADFIKWSADPEAQKLILAPPFYFVVKGAAWEIPHKEVGAVAQAQPAVEFSVQQKYQEYKQLKTKLEQDRFIADMTPDQRREFARYRMAEQEKENKAKAPAKQPSQPGRQYPPNRSGTGGGGGRQPPGRGGEGDAIDPQLLREMFADSDAGTSKRRYAPSPEEGVYRRRDTRRDNEEGSVQPQQQILVNLQPNNMGNVDIWAHDETAQPGRTYRYRLRVVIKNPLFDTKNVAANPKMAEVPYLPAELASGGLDPNAGWSDWSKPVAVPTNVDLMLVNAQTLNGREIARFRVKRFQEGQVNEAPKAFEVAPGDMIGGPEKVQLQAAAGGGAAPAGPAKTMTVDFTTSWTLVDIRQTGGDYRVRIMDSEGRMEVRTVAGDRNRFKEETPKANAAAAANQVGMVRQPQN